MNYQNIHSPWAPAGVRHLSKNLQKLALEKEGQGRGIARRMLSGISVLLKTKRLRENRRLILQVELKIHCFSVTSLKSKLGTKGPTPTFISTDLKKNTV